MNNINYLRMVVIIFQCFQFIFICRESIELSTRIADETIEMLNGEAFAVWAWDPGFGSQGPT